MELTYTNQGDYRLPDLSVPEEPEVHLGKYALLRRSYLKEHRRILFTNLLTSGKLIAHLLEIEEAALIDGCTPLRTFFSVVLPIMKPTYISVGILETMWIWNDFLLPYLVLDLNKYKTISIAIQYMKGSYGRVDMGAIMAALILAVIPVIIFYLSCQKHIIKGVAAGAVKG